MSSAYSFEPHDQRVLAQFLAHNLFARQPDYARTIEALIRRMAEANQRACAGAAAPATTRTDRSPGEILALLTISLTDHQGIQHADSELYMNLAVWCATEMLSRMPQVWPITPPAARPSIH